MGTPWESQDKSALPPSLAQHHFLSTSRAGLKGFCQGCSDPVPASGTCVQVLSDLGSVFQGWIKARV